MIEIATVLKDLETERKLLQGVYKQATRIESRMRLMQLATERSAQERDAAILAMRKQGMSYDDIAELLCCSTRQVGLVLSRHGLVDKKNVAKGKRTQELRRKANAN